MIIYGISQEIYSCAVYPGDPAPQRLIISDMADNARYNLTAFSMGAPRQSRKAPRTGFPADDVVYCCQNPTRGG